MEGAREAKVPKFKRCKISRQQLVVLMQHFWLAKRYMQTLC